MRWQVLLACLLCAAPALAQETKVATAGPEYGASPTLRRWFGDGYRDVWTTPISVPVLDLGKEAGGLEPVRQVGGLQTAGLAFRGADGKSYTFRSLHKEPERLLRLNGEAVFQQSCCVMRHRRPILAQAWSSPCWPTPPGSRPPVRGW